MPVEHDFLTWTSFPSSAKITNDGAQTWVYWPRVATLPVSPGNVLRGEIQAKQRGVIGRQSHILFADAATGRSIGGVMVPLGDFDWTKCEAKITIPEGVSVVGISPAGGGGTAHISGVTWFDDLKIYLNDALVYSDDFSNWSPVIGAGVGAPIGGVAGYLLKEPLGPVVSEAVGAVLGGALGGGIGLLTGLGIIPVPQIPSLGAAPEEPGAPMRLGKYQITG